MSEILKTIWNEIIFEQKKLKYLKKHRYKILFFISSYGLAFCLGIILGLTR